MTYQIGKIEVWAGDIMNRPGMLARVLEAVSNAGAELEFLVARRASENTSRVFLAPLTGAKQKKAARDVGLAPTAGMHAIRVEGPDRPGLGAKVSRAVADQGINLRGMSAAAVGKKSVLYLGFATEEELKGAAKAVRKSLAGKA